MWKAVVEERKGADFTPALTIAAICSRIRELQGAIAAAVIVLEISSRGADMAEVPGGSTGLLARDMKGKEADTPVYRIDPGVVWMSAAKFLSRRPRKTVPAVGSQQRCL